MTRKLRRGARRDAVDVRGVQGTQRERTSGGNRRRKATSHTRGRKRSLRGKVCMADDALKDREENQPRIRTWSRGLKHS